MADVREIGRVLDIDGEPVIVAVAGWLVLVGNPDDILGLSWELTPEAADELAQHLVTAWWLAHEDEDGPGPRRGRPQPAVEATATASGGPLAAGDPTPPAASPEDCWLPCDTDCEVGPAHCWNWHRPNHKPDWHDPAACDAGRQNRAAASAEGGGHDDR